MDPRGVVKQDTRQRPSQNSVPSLRTAVLRGLFLAVAGVLFPFFGMSQLEGDGWTVLLNGVGLFYLISGIGFSAYGLYYISRIPSAVRLDRDGVTTTGVVLDKWTRGRRNPMHFIAYEFRDGLQAKGAVSRKTYGTLSAGSMVTVRYLPDNPAVSRLEFIRDDS